MSSKCKGYVTVIWHVIDTSIVHMSQANGDAGMDWWAHQSSNLSYMLQLAANSCGPCHSNTGSKGYKVANYPVNLQTTKSTPTKGTQGNLGHMPLNKWRTLPCNLYSHFLRGTEVAMTKGQWLLKGNLDVQLPKDPDDQPLAHVHSHLYNPNPLHKQNNRDVTKWCHNHLFPSSGGKNLAHAQ